MEPQTRQREQAIESIATAHERLEDIEMWLLRPLVFAMNRQVELFDAAGLSEKAMQCREVRHRVMQAHVAARDALGLAG